MIYKAPKVSERIRAHRMMDARWQKRPTESSVLKVGLTLTNVRS